MVNENVLKSALRKTFKGKDFEIIPVPVNGLIKKAIRFNGKDASPLVYIEEKDSAQTIIEKVNKVYRLANEIDVNWSCINRDYLQTNLYVSMQKKTQDGCMKESFLNLEAVLRLALKAPVFYEKGYVASIKVQDVLLGEWGLSAREAWDIAFRNSRESLNMISMAEYFGFSEEEFNVPLTIVTTKNYYAGASALLFQDIFRKYCEKKNLPSCNIIPSSIHEVLIVPSDVDIDTEVLKAMVDEVNRSEVKPEEQLEPVIYSYDRLTDKVKIAS